MFFDNEGERLYGMLHAPEDRKRFYPGIVMCHGFTGEKVEANRLFVTAARELAGRGFVALRFDFRGSGESEGDFSDVTFPGEVSDALAALEFLAEQPEVDTSCIGVLGLSMGGAVAAVAAARSRLVRAVVLWSAVARMELIGDLVRARTLATLPNQRGFSPTVFDIGGLAVGEDFIESLGEFDPLREIARTKAPVLVVHGTGDEVVPPEHAALYCGALEAAGGRHERLDIPGADHVYSSLQWQNDVINASIAWFARHLR